jgi:hypothetical protein
VAGNPRCRPGHKDETTLRTEHGPLPGPEGRLIDLIDIVDVLPLAWRQQSHPELSSDLDVVELIWPGCQQQGPGKILLNGAQPALSPYYYGLSPCALHNPCKLDSLDCG